MSKTVADSGITTYVDSTATVTSSTKSGMQSFLSKTDPYLKSGIESVLTRSYQIDSFTWAATDVIGVRLWKGIFPALLIAKQFMQDKLKYFLYMRSAIKITFRINTTKFDYGTLAICRFPFYSSDIPVIELWRSDNLWSSLQNNAVFLDATSGETVSVIMPWVNPYQFMLTDSPIPEIGECHVRVLHPLTAASSDPPASIQVAVFAELVHPEIAGYAPDFTPAPKQVRQTKKLVTASSIETQSAPKRVRLFQTQSGISEETRAWIKNGGLDRDGHGKNDPDSCHSDYVKTQADKPAAKPEINLSSDGGKLGFNVKSEMNGAKVNFKGSTNTNQIVKEGQNKEKSGVLSGIVEAVSSVAPVLGVMMPEFLPLSIGATILGPTVARWLRSVGLDKPPMMGPPTRIETLAGTDISQAKGLDHSTKISYDPDYQVSVDKAITGFDDPVPDVLQIMKRPSLIGIGLFTNALKSPGETITSWVASPCAGYALSSGATAAWFMTYSGFFTQYYRWWHGSLKYMIRFTTSTFVTCRVRISHILTPLISSVEDVSGDLVSQVVDVTGTTIVKFSIPYLAQLPYLETRHPKDADLTDNLGKVSVSLVDKIMSVDPTNDPPVYYSVFQAVGDDFRLMKMDEIQILSGATQKWNYTSVVSLPKDVRPIRKRLTSAISSEVVAETQCDLIAEFADSFPGLAPAHFVFEAGAVNGEDAGTIQNMLHRYSNRFLSSTTFNTVRALPVVVPNSTERHGATVAMFMFMRGAGRVALLFNANTTTFVGLTPGPNAGGGSTVRGNHSNVGINCTSTDLTSSRAEIPWYDNRLFVETVPSIDATRTDNWDAITGPTVSVWSSVGDDFSLGCLSSTPISFVTNNPEIPVKERQNHGYHGLDVEPLQKSSSKW